MVNVVRAGSNQLDTVLTLIDALLKELSDDPARFVGLDVVRVRSQILAAEEQFTAFLAVDASGGAVGVITLTEAGAAYAGGWYGIISDLYVAPQHRGTGVGRQLLDAVRAEARSRGWRRLDVTAPPQARWDRTVAFYEQNGFIATGRKLKCLMDAR